MTGRWPEVEAVAEAVGVGWALGMALFSATYFVLYLCAVPDGVALSGALIVAIGAVGVGVWRLLAARAYEQRPESAPRAVLVGSLGIVAVQAALTVWIAVHSLLRHDDAWTVWAIKARMFALGGPPHGYFTSLDWTSHPNYPLNLPLVEALFFHLPDPVGLTLAALVVPMCLASLLLLFYAGISRLYGRGPGAAASAALVLVPSLPRFAGYGYADIPISLYVGAAALYLALWWRCRRTADLLLMALCAGAAIWTKREGLPIAALVLMAYLVGERRRHARLARALPQLLTVGAVALLVSLPWLIFTRFVRPPGTDDLPLTATIFVHNLGRLPTLIVMLLQEGITVERWSLFWVVVALVTLVSVPRLSAYGRGLVALLVLQLGVYVGSYIFSSWVPYTRHVDSSLNRLLIQAVPLALLVLVEALQVLRLAPLIRRSLE